MGEIRFAKALNRTHLILAGLLLIIVMILRRVMGWQSNEWLIVLAGMGLWMVGAWIFSRFRLPRTAKALRLLDRLGGWKDCYSSAWDFGSQEEPSQAQSLHIRRAQATLEEAREAIPALLPIPPVRRAWAAPLLVLLLASTPWGRLQPDPLDLALTTEMREAAALQAENLLREAERLRSLAGQDEEKAKEVEALLAEVESMAKELADPEGTSVGEMLESLEERARAAEKLAEKLAPHVDAWASEEMLAEMARHTDTADLSLLIGDKAASGAADETDKIAKLLAGDAMTVDILDRMTRALEGISAAETEEDKARPVGEHFENASQKILDASAKIASREFEELAKFFRELAEQDAIKAQLDKLAENLREAGGEIGGSELKKMEEIAAAAASAESPLTQGLQTLSAPTESNQPMDLPGLDSMMKDSSENTGNVANAAQSSDNPPVPGSPSVQEGEPGQQPGEGEQTFSAPVPGEKAPDNMAASGMGMENQSQEGKGDSGMLSAPIPGTSPGESGMGTGMNLGGGSSTESGLGGDQAGTGTAALQKQEPSDSMKASSESTVFAQAGKEGESTMRAVEGKKRQENAKRSRQDVVADFLEVQEQALDDQTLPLSRREQVLRYFSGVRAQFEKADTE